MIAVITVALGVGANSAIFALVDATLLRPLPYADPSRLVAIYETTAGAWWSSIVELSRPSPGQRCAAGSPRGDARVRGHFHPLAADEAEAAEQCYREQSEAVLTWWPSRFVSSRAQRFGRLIYLTDRPPMPTGEISGKS